MVIHRKTRDERASILRIPIALKFAVFIAVLAVAAMTWQTITAIDAAKEGVDQEINKSGILLVTALASLIDPALVHDLSRQDDLRQVLKAFRERPGAEQVLNVVVYNEATQQAVATARDEARFSITVGETIDEAAGAAAGVEIREFAYESIPARSFSVPYARTAAAAGSPAAVRVAVYVSAAQIAESMEKVSSAMVKVSAASCLAATVGAFLLAQFLSRPIRGLVKDMKHVSLGHLDHQAAVLSSDELGDLAHAFNRMTASLRTAQDAKLAQKALEHELALATSIQTRLLPAALPNAPGFDFAHYYMPAKEVGGDYFDFVKIDAEHLGVTVADVSGKGIPAALIMTMTRTLLRAAAKGELSPARTVELVNRFLTPDMNPGMFVTLAYCILNVKTREARLVRCGHNPPLLFSSKHEKVLHLHPRGMALGLDREGALFQSELQVQRFVLQPRDVLVAYTDGIVEGKDRESHDYSQARLESVIAAHAAESAGDIIAAVVADLARHAHGTEPSDDVTLIVIKSLQK